MASTNTQTETLAKALGEADPNRLADALRQYGLGTHLSPQKFTFLGAAGATAQNITTAAWLARATPGSATPTLPIAQATLPPILSVVALRVTTGPSGAAGTHIISDAGGTPAQPNSAAVGAPGIALLSDDGTTLTFASAVSGFVLEYIPRSARDVNGLFENT